VSEATYRRKHDKKGNKAKGKRRIDIHTKSILQVMDFCNYKQYTESMTSALDPAYIIFGIKHSGKTTQGRLLAQKLSFSFVDIDEIITKQTGFTPRQIYFDYGPEKFMSAEEKICSVLEKKCFGKKIVIATGGGICDNAPALMRLRDLGTFIFLEVSEQIAFDRILEKIKLPKNNVE